MKTKVFAHKGIIGISSDENADGVIAKFGNGNIGCVCDASQVEISKEAFDLLLTIPRGRDSLGDIDVFKANDGMVIFAWLGGYLKVLDPKKIQASREYNPKLLNITDGVITTKDFISFVDNM